MLREQTTSAAEHESRVAATRWRWGVICLVLVGMCLSGCQITTRRARFQTWVDWRRFYEPRLYWERDTITKYDHKQKRIVKWDKRQFTDPRLVGGKPSVDVADQLEPQSPVPPTTDSVSPTPDSALDPTQGLPAPPLPPPGPHETSVPGGLEQTDPLPKTPGVRPGPVAAEPARQRV